MRHATFLSCFAALLLAGCSSEPNVSPEQLAKIELKPVTVSELTDHFAEQKGKVVLIDCWFLA